VRNNLADLARVFTSSWATALASEHCLVVADQFDRGVIGQCLNGVAAQAEDLLLVYYAGHGLIGPDGSLYLSLPNTRSDREMVSWTGLPFELLRETLANARAVNRVLILDCCFSGLALGDLMTDVPSAVSGQIEVAGTCTLTSSPSNRPSRAPAAARNTAYTGEMLEVLRRGPADDTELLTITAIHEHLERLLPSKGFPRPEQRNTRTIGRLALAGRRPRMVEPYGGGTGFRFKIRNVNIDGQGETVHVLGGGTYELSFDVLHDCSECGNAINQVIVGLAGQDRAQASVWNGKQRSGGGLKVVNPGTNVAAMAEDNPGPAEWVNVSCDIIVPDTPGTYSVRARYAQAYQGRLMTAEGRTIPQPEYQDVLGWWKVDRPDGPGLESAIGTIIVEP
jgi:hypothetical protein